MASDFTWPKPWLLGLYQQAIEEGCIRIRLRGKTPEQNATEFRSFKAAFLRCRRRTDSAYIAQIQPEFHMVQVKFEPELGKVLISYSALPDDQLLPQVEAVDGKRNIPQPVGSKPHPTPETAPEEFDATAHVESLLKSIDLSSDEEPSDEL